MKLNSYIYCFRSRSDRCDELKEHEIAYLEMQKQLEEVEHKNKLLEERKIKNLSR